MAAPTVPSDPASAATATSELVNKILAFLRYLEDTESATPTWTQSQSADPTIGNGTLTCPYQLVNKSLTCGYVVVSGTTTTMAGDGGNNDNYATLTLPESSTVTGDLQRQTLTGALLDASAGDVYGCHVQFVDAEKFRVVWTKDDTPSDAERFWSGDQPFDFDANAGNLLVVGGTMQVD